VGRGEAFMRREAVFDLWVDRRVQFSEELIETG
jgi:1,2-phenylacetyl-CoA epoxidase PaaB subunit